MKFGMDKESIERFSDQQTAQDNCPPDTPEYLYKVRYSYGERKYVIAVVDQHNNHIGYLYSPDL